MYIQGGPSGQGHFFQHQNYYKFCEGLYNVHVCTTGGHADAPWAVRHEAEEALPLRDATDAEARAGEPVLHGAQRGLRHGEYIIQSLIPLPVVSMPDPEWREC